MMFPASLVDFVPNLWLIPLGILILPGKKPCMYQHGTFMVDQDSYPINHLVKLDMEPEITFGKALLKHLEYIWHIQVTYPGIHIFL
jgi:hypothetical protein